jgi:hypothetical protein
MSRHSPLVWFGLVVAALIVASLLVQGCEALLRP